MARWDRRTRLTAMLGLKDETKRGLASASRGFQGYMSGMSRNTGMAGMAVTGALSGHAAFAGASMGAAFAGFAGSAISEFIALEKKWAEVTTLMPTLNQEALGQMKADIDRFSRETGTTLEDAYEAAYQAVSAGINPESTASFLSTAHQAALAGVTDITTAVDGLTSVLNAYGMETANATQVSDAMFTAIRLGKTTFREMAPVLGPVLPIASALGTEFQEITAAVASLTAQGNPTSIALTQIRSALVALSKDTKARGLFEGLTGLTYQQFQAQGGTFQEALSMIVKEAERTGKSLTDLFGRVEGSNAALALSSQRGAELYQQALADTVGATEEAYQKMAETTDHRLNIIKSNWQGLKTGIGEALTEIGTGFVGYVSDFQTIWGGQSVAEKAALKESEDRWVKYATAIAKVQNAQLDWTRKHTANMAAAVLGGGFQPAAVPGGAVRTQAGPANVGAWVYGMGNLSARGGDVWSLADMNARFEAVLLQNVRDAQQALFTGGGGGGGGVAGALRDNTDALNALREQLEEEMERNRQLEVAPGEVPVLPEFLQASELRYISRMVQNKLVGGVVS